MTLDIVIQDVAGVRIDPAQLRLTDRAMALLVSPAKAAGLTAGQRDAFDVVVELDGFTCSAGNEVQSAVARFGRCNPIGVRAAKHFQSVVASVLNTMASERQADSKGLYRRA